MEKIYEFLSNTLGKVSGRMGVAVAISIYAGWHFMGGFKKGWSNRKQQLIYKRSDKTNDGYLDIRAICFEIKGLLDADRVNVFTYSNGVKDKSGLCYDYVSTVGEACKEGVSSLWNVIQNMPINPQFREVIDRIQKSENGYLRVAQGEEFGEQKLVQKEYGIETSYSFKLAGNVGSVWEGVVTVSWTHVDRKLIEGEIEAIKFKVSQIYNIKKSISNQ